MNILYSMKLDSIFNTKKGLVIGLLVTVFIAFIGRYLSEHTVNESELDFYEEKTKEKLPISLGFVGAVSNVYYTNDDIVYVCNVNEQNISVSELKSDINETWNNCGLNLMCDKNQAKHLFCLLNKYGKGIKVIYKGKNDSLEIKFSPSEVKELASTETDPQKAAIEHLETYVSEKNAQCPVNSDSILTLVQLKLDKSSLYYYYTIDERQDFTIDSLKENIQLSDLLLFIKDPTIKPKGWEASLAGLGLRLLFTSAQTGQQKVYRFHKKEDTK